MSFKAYILGKIPSFFSNLSYKSEKESLTEQQQQQQLTKPKQNNNQKIIKMGQNQDWAVNFENV